ncbi:glycosyltransferase [Shewanella sp. YIC-542]|uniref:glycosyltransferase n=1 Tax=Shewanella mytili TaxID=3377111 RepID=UPI00398EECD8
MKFSVLMSLYYKENPDYLNDCLASLFNQTVRADEVIIVFDGPVSADLTSVVDLWLSKLNIIIVPIDVNVGLGNALNIGLKHCTFDLVARMDTDDICLPERFEQQLSIFDRNEDISICGSSIDEFDESMSFLLGHRRVSVSNIDIVRDLPRKNPFNHMTVMYRKNHIISVGGYKHLPWMEDWYLWIRLLSHGFKGMNIYSSLVFARTGDSMIGRRIGLDYVRSEWRLTKIKISLGVVSPFVAYFIFLKRSIPRLLPKPILRFVYSISRKCG